MSKQKGPRGYYRKMLGEDNKQKILKVLAKENLTFNEIKQRLGWKSSTVLTNHLTEMKNRDEITHIPDDNKKRYVYSVKPETIIKEIIIPNHIFSLGLQTLRFILETELKDENKVSLEYPIKIYYENIINEYSRFKMTPQQIIEILKSYTNGEW